MPDLSSLVDHWGYLAIFAVVVLGNLGLPVPEETILVLAGYLTWQGRLRFPLVVGTGILAAVAGDNLGYWIGRKLGRSALERYGRRVFVSPRRLDQAQRLVAGYGSYAVFVARFITGFRFLAGPTAGIAGLTPLTFFTANVMGAATYVPLVVGAGYGVGYGLGDYIRRLEKTVGRVEYLVLAVALVVTLMLLIWRIRRTAPRTRDR